MSEASWGGAGSRAGQRRPPWKGTEGSPRPAQERSPLGPEGRGRGRRQSPHQNRGLHAAPRGALSPGGSSQVRSTWLRSPFNLRARGRTNARCEGTLPDSGTEAKGVKLEPSFRRDKPHSRPFAALPSLFEYSPDRKLHHVKHFQVSHSEAPDTL